MALERDERDAAALEAGYARSHRIYELSGILGTVVTGTWLFVNILQCNVLSGWWVPLAALLGILAADFTSGFVHWMFDTWGSTDTPFFGPLAIRTFRHHHVDEKAITRHDFVETNGHNFMLSFPVAIVGIVVVRPETATLLDVFVGMALLGLVVFNACTSQIHKWAHPDERPRVVQLLQRARLIISPEHHALHHAPPHTRNYCITLGWLNGPLRAVRFFETLERVITAITGAVPREDDLGETVALEVAAELSRDAEVESAAPAPVTARD
ncbi:fatty acid desaturase CarF family protein [soil metagenome]